MDSQKFYLKEKVPQRCANIEVLNQNNVTIVYHRWEEPWKIIAKNYIK